MQRRGRSHNTERQHDHGTLWQCHKEYGENAAYEGLSMVWGLLRTSLHDEMMLLDLPSLDLCWNPYLWSHISDSQARRAVFKNLKTQGQMMAAVKYMWHLPEDVPMCVVGLYGQGKVKPCMATLACSKWKAGPLDLYSFPFHPVSKCLIHSRTCCKSILHWMWFLLYNTVLWIGDLDSSW